MPLVAVVLGVPSDASLIWKILVSAGALLTTSSASASVF